MVACGNCGRGLVEPSDLPADQREPCPICGSTARSFSTTVQDFAVGSEAATVTKAPVENVPVEDTPEAEAVRGRYRATLEWHMLEDGFWLLHVLNEQAEVVEGGIGDDPETALLEVYERLVPPT